MLTNALSRRSSAPWPMASALIAVALLLFCPLSASAFGVSIRTITSTNPLDQLVAGDEFSVGIVVSNPDQRNVAGIGIGAFGYDDNILRPTIRETGPNIFSTVVVETPIGFDAFGGIGNLLFPNQNPPTSRDGGSVSVYTQLFLGVNISAANGTGELDIGVDGGLVGDGDVHSRITFEVLGGGMTSIQFGGITPNGDTVVLGGRLPDGSFEPGTGNTEDTEVVSLDITALGDPFVPTPSDDDTDNPGNGSGGDDGDEPDGGNDGSDGNDGNNGGGGSGGGTLPPVIDPPDDGDDGMDPPLIPPTDMTPTGGGGMGGGGPTSAVPEPTGALLFAIGLASVSAVQRRRDR